MCPIAAGIGALLGAAVALLVERLDAKIRDRRKAEEAFGAVRRRRAADADPQAAGRPPRRRPGASTTPRPRRSARCGRRSRSWPPAGNRSPTTIGSAPSSSPRRARPRARRRSPSTSPRRSPRPVARVVARQRRLPAAARLEDPRRRAADRCRRPSTASTGSTRQRSSSPTKVPGVAVARPLPARRRARRSHPGDGPAGDRARRAGRRPRRSTPRRSSSPPRHSSSSPRRRSCVLVGRIGRTATAAAQRAGELARFGGAEQVAVALNDTGSTRLRRTTYYDYYGGRRGRSRRDTRPRRRAGRRRAPPIAAADDGQRRARRVAGDRRAHRARADARAPASRRRALRPAEHSPPPR